jgi:hypothetical protein
VTSPPYYAVNLKLAISNGQLAIASCFLLTATF